MTSPLFTPRAGRELRQAASWIAQENPVAAENLLEAAIQSAQRVLRNPLLARTDLALAPARYRFWSLRGYPYLLVIDTEEDPPIIARFVHQSRDLPAALNEL